jgi:hypothetical protein
MILQARQENAMNESMNEFIGICSQGASGPYSNKKRNNNI